MLNEFIEYLESQVDKGLYVLGGQTQVIHSSIVFEDDTEKKSLGTLKQWMERIGQSNNYSTVYKLYQKRLKALGDIPLRIMDCSGLGMNFIQNMKHMVKGDMTANGMLGKCKRLTKAELKKGDWVFRTYKTGVNKGNAYHIGYIVDSDLNVVEDYGKTKGVIKRPIDTSYWNTYGRPSYFREEIEHEEKSKVVFTRVLKRVKPTMTGDDVKALQTMLNEANGANLAVDGKFGTATEKAVKSYQKLKGLVVDGKAGKNTITALGGIYKK